MEEPGPEGQLSLGMRRERPPAAGDGCPCRNTENGAAAEPAIPVPVNPEGQLSLDGQLGKAAHAGTSGMELRQSLPLPAPLTTQAVGRVLA